MEFLKDNLSGERAIDFLRERKTVKVSRVGAPDDRGVGNVLAEKRGDLWTVVGKFGFTPGLCAVRPGLLGVRTADRDVEGGVRVAKGGGEDVGGSGVSARDEARDLSL